ncbi:MAG: VWA domain-containing protein [Chloroflexota bacterium]
MGSRSFVHGSLVGFGALALIAASGTATIHAQQPCSIESEPNETPEQAAVVVGPICLEGTLISGDQDLLLWDVRPEDTAVPWAFEVQGIAGTLTSLKVFELASEPGDEPIEVVSRPIIDVGAEPDSLGPGSIDGVLLPAGRYLLGISRSKLLSGDEPFYEDYRYRIERGEPPSPSLDVEPNDDAASAVAVEDAFALTGDLAGSTDFYAWTVDGTERWDLDLKLPLGTVARLEILTPDGRVLDDVSAQGRIQTFDLALETGRYLVTVGPSSNEPMPYVLTATPTSIVADAEPNDDTADAVIIEDGQLVTGRLARPGDSDRYTLLVARGDRSLRDVRLVWRSGLERQLCLLDDEDERVLCRRGDRGVSLTGLALPPGRNTFELRGPEDASDLYRLRVDPTSEAAADFESEPNNDVARASVIDPVLGMRGRGSGDDEDIFLLRTQGEPQLWQLDLAGSDIVELAQVSPVGIKRARGDIDGEGSFATIRDLYLLPGDHWFRVRTGAASYPLQATPMGPPDPDAEREPNDDASRAQRYRIGTRRVGRLPTASDRDFYRFTLAAPQHIRLDLTQPAEARTALRLSDRDEAVAELRDLPPGEPIGWDLWLEPGDYVLELDPQRWSEGTYELSSERLDPFELRIDQEPNDDPRSARAIPPTLAWEGQAGYPGDEDWYALPALTSDELVIGVTGQDAVVRLAVAGTGSAEVEQLVLDLGPDGRFISTGHPPGVPLVLMVASAGEYRVELSGAGLDSVDGPGALPLEMSWQISADEAAAYWPQEQIIESSLELTNRSTADMELKLGTVTSHYLWQASLADVEIDVPAGETIEVPATIVVGADAWGSEPVLVSARAIASDGAQVSASVSIATSAEAPPVDPRQGWSVPDELLGGLNAASVAFGAEPGGTLDLDNERRLFDSVTPQGSVAIASPIYRNGFVVYITDHVERLPIEMIVDLAGDEAVTVVGTIINIQAGDGDLSEAPRDFELLLSRDGLAWEPAVAGTLSSLSIDQPFVLDEPMGATHAMLRITSMYGGQAGFLALGEWKVVLAPGVAISDDPIDIADPARGGYLVSIEPMGRQPDVGTLLLDDELVPDAIAIEAGEGLELVIGFRDGRAAMVQRLEWRDPDGSDPGKRLERVEVAVSLLSPTGPWRSIGSWELERAADRSVEPFALDDSTWVRYLRLRGTGPVEARSVELPATLHILERATDERYRSIIGEWGYRSAQATYEWLGAGDTATSRPTADAGDDMAGATVLAAGAVVADRVEIDADEDWFGIVIPAGQNTLEIRVDGRPTVRVALSLFDEVGFERPMAFRIGDDGSVRYQAGVEPGARYTLQVRQPPFSAVFAFDTSGSIDPFLEMVTQGMRSFLADVRPGREAVTLLPFEEAPLLAGWLDDPYVLGAAFEGFVVRQGSSAAETALIDASKLLREREGGRAVLLVTDAETTSAERTRELWDELARVRPIIFSVHIGAVVEPLRSRQRMQDWAASGGGYYSYPTTAGEMDRAFERMATWLRRPADYTLSYETLNLGPSTLGVRAPAEGADGGGSTGLAPGVGVEIILDTSGSMLKKLAGERRIDIARDSLRSLIGEALADDVPVALRTFGGKGKKKAARCQTRLTLPLQPLVRQDMLELIGKLNAKKKTKTPIAAALAEVADDLAGVRGPRSVILVTDGDETCGGDPIESIEALQAAGIDINLNIVGFALDDEELKLRMAAWAEAGDGTYFDAAGADELATAMATALSAPFRVYGPDGEIFEGGTVGGDPILIDPGTYRVEVLADPPFEFDEVVVGAGESIELVLPAE